MDNHSNQLDDLRRSEIVIARILNLLIGWGIQECQLEFHELELEEEFAPFFFPCINWLISEGVIRASSVERYSSNKTSAGGVVLYPQLTSYGFNALGSEIQIGDNTPKLATAVKEVSDNQKSYSQIGDFVGGLLGGFSKSLSS